MMLDAREEPISPADQDSSNDHASCPSGSVRMSADDGGNLRNSTAAKDGAAIKPAGTGTGMGMQNACMKNKSAFQH